VVATLRDQEQDTEDEGEGEHENKTSSADQGSQAGLEASTDEPEKRLRTPAKKS
jgi:hypothetical protein